MISVSELLFLSLFSCRFSSLRRLTCAFCLHLGLFGSLFDNMGVIKHFL